MAFLHLFRSDNRKPRRGFRETDHRVDRYEAAVKSAAMPSPRLPVESAKEFLISKVLKQADEDGILLSELERRMLSFSEGTASADDIEAAEQFDNEYASDAYEAKIARLLRRAYERDAKLGQKHLWHAAVRALRSEDWYIVVMLQQAGIKGAAGWHVTILCICAAVEMLVGLSYARGVIGLGWAVIGLVVFGYGIVRQLMLIKGYAGNHPSSA
jgi:hypothetical protein